MRCMGRRCGSTGLLNSPDGVRDRQRGVGLSLVPLIVEVVRRSSVCIGLVMTVVTQSICRRNTTNFTWRTSPFYKSTDGGVLAVTAGFGG